MEADRPTDFESAAINAQSSPGIVRSRPTKTVHTPERRPSKLAPIREDLDYDSQNQAYERPSASTSLQTSTPRSSLSNNSEEDEFVVLFESKDQYMNQDVFDRKMLEHGIEEEVSHRICRVETNLGESIPDAQWDDPSSEYFPVRCVYRRLSMPSTPEPPMRELLHDDVSIVANLLTQQLHAPLVGTMAPAYSGGSLEVAWYQVSYCGGITILETPDSYSATENTLPSGTVFAVSELVVGSDQCQYLRLADGTGWILDDSMLFTTNPSVLRLPSASTPSNDYSNDFVDLSCGHTTQFATAPRIPIVYREGCITVPASPLVANLTPSSPHRRSPLATIPVSNVATVSDECGVKMIPLRSVPYQVQVSDGLNVLTAPDAGAPLTGTTLSHGEVFQVSESVLGVDGWQYLRLADGAGWVLAETLSASSPENIRDEKSKGKSKSKESKGHVPYWVRLRHAKQKAEKKARAGAVKH